MRAACGVLLTALISGCGSTAALNGHGEKVRVRYSGEPSANCKKLGEYYGGGANADFAINNLRNIAGEHGANVVMVTRREEVHATLVLGQPYLAFGTAFACDQTVRKP